MRSIVSALLIAIAAASVAATAQNLCPCVPLTKQWTVTTCDSWNCASSALVLANGDTFTFAIPVAENDHRWLIVKRLTAGTASQLPPADDPFQIEAFDNMTVASSRYLGMPSEQRPMLMTAPDGHVLVLSLKTAEPRHRVAPK